MKLLKILLILLAGVLLTSGLSSCSKNSFAGSRTVGVSPVTPKYTMVRKKYIINNRRRPILGLDSRK